MTKMREVQTAETSARIVLGGSIGKTVKEQLEGPPQEKWYMSRIPGVLEEVYLSAKANQPVFLIGAYGGAAAMVIDIIEGRDRHEATWDFQKSAPHSEALKQIYAERGLNWETYEEITDYLRNKGITGINPLLTEAENRELHHTIDLIRMVELVIGNMSKINNSTVLRF